MSDALENLFGEDRSKRHRGCVVCGQENVAMLQIRLAEIGDDGRWKKGGRSRSFSRSVCAEHAVSLWDQLVGVVAP